MRRPKSLFDEDSAFLTREECQRLANLALASARAEATLLNLVGYSAGNLRSAFNRPSDSGDVTNTELQIETHPDLRQPTRQARIVTNRLEDEHVVAAVTEAERLATYSGSDMAPSEADLAGTSLLLVRPPQSYLEPAIWSESSVNLDAGARADAARRLVRPSEAAGLRSAGYVEVGAAGYGVANSAGLFAYYRYTTAQYSVTVRTRDGTGSGWAGVSDHDWARIDAAALTERAVQKCVASANPSALEPGRYTLIMEPQAVADMVLMVARALSRRATESGRTPFFDPTTPDWTKIGQRVVDERLTLSTDPMDPEGGCIPFTREGVVYRPVKWIENGILRNLFYDRGYVWGVRHHGHTMRMRHPDASSLVEGGLDICNSVRLSGGDTSLDEMIATTRRGLLVTRFHRLVQLQPQSLLSTGNTRDGLWLVENGKITKPIKNFRFHESAMFIFNNIEQLGRPVRVFTPMPRGTPPMAAIVPALKVRDFNFTSLVDAV